MTDDEKNTFIDDYFAHEGIRLDPAKIAYNKGIRDTMKIILNSLWGKFGQRGNRTQSKICLLPKDFYSIVLNDDLEIKDLFLCPNNPKLIELLYTEKETTASEPLNTNVYIASFTTCNARLRLYDVLDKLGTTVLYYDTDSVIVRRLIADGPPDFLGKIFYLLCPSIDRNARLCSFQTLLSMPVPSGHDPDHSCHGCDGGFYLGSIGPFLGDFTNELCDDGKRYIVEFVSTGPKSYSYKDNHGRISCKFKGITKTLYNLQIVNLGSMLECVQRGRVYTAAKNLNFKLNKHGQILTQYVLKTFRLVYDKRWISDRYVTFPWGF